MQAAASHVATAARPHIFFALAVSFYCATGRTIKPLRDLLYATGAPVLVGASMWLFLETHNPADDSCWGRLLRFLRCAVRKRAPDGGRPTKAVRVGIGRGVHFLLLERQTHFASSSPFLLRRRLGRHEGEPSRGRLQ